jgi:hypothetical protein
MPIRYSEITPRSVYLSRRAFLAGASAKLTPAKSPFSTTETQTPYRDITTYNNFYEFGTEKQQPSQRAHTLITSPWSVAVEGLVARPRVIDIDEILKLAPLEGSADALRRGLVDGDLGRVLVEQLISASTAEQAHSSELLQFEANARGKLGGCGFLHQGCEWTRPFTRSRCFASGFTATCCPSRTGPRCA